jgi:hypothetical protein
MRTLTISCGSVDWTRSGKPTASGQPQRIIPEYNLKNRSCTQPEMTGAVREQRYFARYFYGTGVSAKFQPIYISRHRRSEQQEQAQRHVYRSGKSRLLLLTVSSSPQTPSGHRRLAMLQWLRMNSGVWRWRNPLCGIKHELLCFN